MEELQNTRLKLLEDKIIKLEKRISILEANKDKSVLKDQEEDETLTVNLSKEARFRMLMALEEEQLKQKSEMVFSMLGKTISIKKGKYKGRTGMINDYTDKTFVVYFTDGLKVKSDEDLECHIPYDPFDANESTHFVVIEDDKDDELSDEDTQPFSYIGENVEVLSGVYANQQGRVVEETEDTMAIEFFDNDVLDSSPKESDGHSYYNVKKLNVLFI